jgi:hypothetical protein
MPGRAIQKLTPSLQAPNMPCLSISTSQRYQPGATGPFVSLLIARPCRGRSWRQGLSQNCPYSGHPARDAEGTPGQAKQPRNERNRTASSRDARANRVAQSRKVPRPSGRTPFSPTFQGCASLAPGYSSCIPSGCEAHSSALAATWAPASAVIPLKKQRGSRLWFWVDHSGAEVVSRLMCRRS